MIYIYNTDGDFIDKATTASEAAEVTQTTISNVSRCVHGKLDQTKGYVFIKLKPGQSKIQTSARIGEYFKLKDYTLAKYLSENLEQHDTEAVL